MDKARDSAGRLVVLDALRGVAALAVVAYHTGVGTGRQYLPHGHLAVDFFFALSGFVLVYAYQARLDGGLATLQFLQLRVARLYPLYLTGLLLGLVREVDHMQRGEYHMPHGWLAVLIVLGLLLLPAPHHAGIPISEAFPFNFPAWSLFHELLANGFHAVFVRRRGWIFLAGLTGASGLAFLLVSLHAQTVDLGARNTNTLLAVPRVLFSYSMGMLVCRWWGQSERRRFAAWAGSPWLLSAVLLGVMAIPTGGFSLAFDLAVIALVFPAMVFAGAEGEVPTKARGLLEMLGLSSYAVYMLHVPCAEYVVPVLQRLTGKDFAASLPWSMFAYMALVLGLALLLDRFYDRPVRRWLAARLLPAQQATKS